MAARSSFVITSKNTNSYHFKTLGRIPTQFFDSLHRCETGLSQTGMESGGVACRSTLVPYTNLVITNSLIADRVFQHATITRVRRECWLKDFYLP